VQAVVCTTINYRFMAILAHISNSSVVRRPNEGGVAGSNNCIHNLLRSIPIGIAIADYLKKVLKLGTYLKVGTLHESCESKILEKAVCCANDRF